MLGIIWQWKPLKQLLTVLLVAGLTWSLFSCAQPPDGIKTTNIKQTARVKLAEVSPPFTLQSLGQSLEVYQPQVKILSPRPNQTLEDTQVEVRLQVKDLPLFKDEDLALGPYLQVLLDNQPYAQVYDTAEPLTIEDLAPGTHTLRVFAARPWHESFKNEGAFAQSTFHVFTPTPVNNPDPNRPLLTYNYPQGVYGAEPILLDFYLTNAPLHLVAREDSQDAIPDWQIRCTINGESFTFDRWEPIYLKGLKPGKNWVQLELLSESGNPIPNAFNNVVQLVTYEPGGADTLARLTRGELTADAARKIVDPNYVPPPPLPEPLPEPMSEPEVLIEPDLTQEPEPETMPPEVVAPALETIPEAAPEVPSEIEPQSEPDSAEPELEVEESAKAAEPEGLSESEIESPEPVVPIPEAIPESLNPSKTDPQDYPVQPLQSGSSTPAIPGPNLDPPETVNSETINSETVNSETLEPETRQPKSIESEAVQPDESESLSTEERLEALEARLKELFQAPEVTQSPSVPSQLESPADAEKPLRNKSLSETAGTQAVPIAPTVVPSSSSAIPEFPVNLELPAVSPEPTTPDFLNLLDRAKAFFEGLRKRSTEPNIPALAPLIEGLDTPEVGDGASVQTNDLSNEPLTNFD